MAGGPAAATAIPPRAAVRPRMTQQERSTLAREKLIGAAIRSICEKGFALTTMAEIAAQAGMTRGAIQHHFESRNDLVLAILHEVEGRVVATFTEAAIDSAMPLADRVGGLIDHFGEIGRSDAYLAVMDLWISTRSDPDLKDAVRESVLRSSNSYRQLWQNSFGGDVPTRVISDCRRVVVAVLRGSVVSRVFVPNPRSYAMALATLKTMIVHHMTAGRQAP